MSVWDKVFGNASASNSAGHVTRQRSRRVSSGRLQSDVLDKAVLVRLQSQTALFNALFALAGHVARADGEVNAIEKAFLAKTIEDFQLNADQKKTALQLFYFGVKQPDDASTLAKRFVQQVNADQRLVAKLFQTQVEIATCDAPINRSEQSALFTIADDLSIARSSVPRVANETDVKVENKLLALRADFELLGAKPEATFSQVKQAYRRLMAKYHPDRLISENAAQETIQQATQHSQSVRAAYERIVAEQDSLTDTGEVEDLMPADVADAEADLDLDKVRIDFGQNY